ncbi:MAG: thiamine pyrophosphate-binding protein, partial [Maribacter sp.]|nr:thiamine pyrophosphate-binding protein [Maribacter sp.]
VNIFKYFTKYSAMVMAPNKMGDMARESLRFALSGRRGPVHINIPRDVLMGETEEAIIPHDKFIAKTKYSNRKNITKAAKLLLNAKKPAMFLGSGTFLADDATKEVYELAKELSIPVMTTPKAKGVFPEDHHLSLGVFGFAGPPTSFAYLVDTGLKGNNENKEPMVKNWNMETDNNVKPNDSNPADQSSKIDVLLSIGTSFNEWGTYAWDDGL